MTENHQQPAAIGRRKLWRWGVAGATGAVGTIVLSAEGAEAAVTPNDRVVAKLLKNGRSRTRAAFTKLTHELVQAAAEADDSALTVALDRRYAPVVTPEEPPSPGPCDIFLVAGQSNAWETQYPDFAYTPTRPEVCHWNASAGEITQTPSKNDEIGFAFARNYAQQHLSPGQRVVTVRCGWGSTGFSSASIAADGYHQSANGTWDRTLTADPLNRYLQMISDAKGALAAAPSGSRIAGVLWSQGEQDRQKARLSQAGWYASRLDDLIEQSRLDLGLAQLPWVVYSMTPSTNVDSPGGALIAKDLAETPARLPWTSFVPAPQGYEKPGEPVHFTTPGQTERGALGVSAYRQALFNS